VSTLCSASCNLDRLGARLASAFERSGPEPWERVFVTGGGCASSVAGPLEGDRHRVPLGRTLPFALGLSLAEPKRQIYAIIGDGEAVGVGGNHLVHAARRGDRIRVMVVNNEVLGAMGGFPSPATPRGGRTSVTPQGSTPRGVDIAEIARAAGAAWVGREIASAGDPLDALLAEFASSPTFSLLEIVAPCYPGFGQWNGFPTPESMREALERRAVRGAVASGAAFAGQGSPIRVGRLWPPEGAAS
jgi:2-oxoglutarate/2-oxoacid ferredoxin oxidoreductase subunit beta